METTERANRFHLVYHPKFDVFGSDEYVFKASPNTVHQNVLSRFWRQGEKVLELGAGHGEVSRRLKEKGADVVAVDINRPDGDFTFPYLTANLDQPFADDVAEEMGEPADTVLALDVIEHLNRPEASLQEIRGVMKPGARLVASTGNVAYVLVRIMLALGQFNYGKKGILDLTHTRLFTVRSFCRTLEGEGFRVETVRGFGPPIRDMVGRGLILRMIDTVASGLARVWPSLFAYQILVEATRLDDVDSLLAGTLESADEPTSLPASTPEAPTPEGQAV